MNTLRLSVLACALCVSAPARGEPRWTTVRSASLTVIGDQSAGRLRDVAIALEQFRAVLGRLSENGQAAATAPTMVYVFGTRKALSPFLPLSNGQPASIAGYCHRDVDANAIALSTEGFDESAPLIYHEYTHLLLGTAVRSLPIWLHEGLAEYYSTYRLQAGGKGADLGLPISRHVQLLRQAFIPLPQLLMVDASSQLYDEGLRRSIFYAESWALTHYLMTELPSGQALINRYAAAVANGAAPPDAFVMTFGTTPAEFEPRLRDYVQRMSFKSWAYRFKDRLETEDVLPARALSRGEADAWLGDLQLRLRRTNEAVRRIETAAAAEPDNAPVQLVLGRLRLFQGRTGEAWPALDRAAQLAPADFAIQYGSGVTSLQYVESAGDDRESETQQHARAALTAATTLNPGSPDAFAWLAYAGIRQRDWDAAARSIATAIALAPGRSEFRIRQADVLILRGTPRDALALLLDLAAHSADRMTAGAARRRLDALDAAGVR